MSSDSTAAVFPGTPADDFGKLEKLAKLGSTDSTGLAGAATGLGVFNPDTSFTVSTASNMIPRLRFTACARRRFVPEDKPNVCVTFPVLGTPAAGMGPCPAAVRPARGPPSGADS